MIIIITIAIIDSVITTLLVCLFFLFFTPHDYSPLALVFLFVGIVKIRLA
jgi:hypothetical protein